MFTARNSFLMGLLGFVQHDSYSLLHLARTRMGNVSRLHFSFFRHQQETRPPMQGITLRSCRNCSHIGRLLWNLSPVWTFYKKPSSHTSQLPTQTQRSMVRCWLCGRIFVFSFAVFTFDNAGQTTEKWFSNQKEVNTGGTGF